MKVVSRSMNQFPPLNYVKLSTKPLTTKHLGLQLLISFFSSYETEMLVAFSHVWFFATLWTVCSPPGSSVHGILQGRILKWVAIPFSRGSSWPKDRTQVSITADRFFTVWATSLNQTPFHCGASFRASKSQPLLGCFGVNGPSSLCCPFCRHSGFSFCTVGPFLIHLPKIWCYSLYQLIPSLLCSFSICACSLYILWLSFWASVLGRIGDKCTNIWPIRSAWKHLPE